MAWEQSSFLTMRIQESPLRTVYFFTSGPVGVQQLPDAQAADEILRFPPHHAALLHQGLQQLQSLRQAPPVHQAPGFRQGFRTARPEGIVLPVRKNSLGAAGRRQKAKEDPCA